MSSRTAQAAPWRLRVIEPQLMLPRVHPGTLRRGRLIEEPSPAELGVLRGLAAGLSRREIGNELYISLNTVKTHARGLCRKLGATSQAQAVARAEAFDLLQPSQSPG